MPPVAHGIGYDTAGSGRGRGTSLNSTGYCTVDLGPGLEGDFCAAPLAPVPEALYAITIATTDTKMVISRRAPAGHRQWARTCVPSAFSYRPMNGMHSPKVVDPQRNAQ
ncbi:hypothetical protein QIS99_28745 [Streptomyces sp. B-S-A8]|uniref:Uncharacterized protein n=1 Tax=Streptomyces solicavernae TaxID=3043614 RepID=A0ABT6S0D7_9ACTN|nr:hypothetical protein [Streptomyces sp. B-S-A8]MDI3390149.1 hypothetical protein [Streptomyces sp. B-S-A8]